jgi:tRNA (cytidine32/uridine32-2'-O)-methyltransferase
MLDNIRIIMANTFHPGNIGAAVRALKNMKPIRLWLVDPRDFPHMVDFGGADAHAANAIPVSEDG